MRGGRKEDREKIRENKRRNIVEQKGRNKKEWKITNQGKIKVIIKEIKRQVRTSKKNNKEMQKRKSGRI